MTSPSATVRITATVTSVVYGVVLYLSGLHIQQSYKQALVYLPSLAGIAIVVFDKWLWKLPLVGHIHGRPRIDGLWRTELTPDADSHIPAGGNRGPIPAYVLVEQSYWSISVTQFTQESESHSKATALIVRHDSGRQVLTFTYENKPRREHLARSPRHIGACEFVILPGAPTRLAGFYFTDRFTAGEMSLELIDRTTNYVDFQSAQARDASP